MDSVRVAMVVLVLADLSNDYVARLIAPLVVVKQFLVKRCFFQHFV